MIGKKKTKKKPKDELDGEIVITWRDLVAKKDQKHVNPELDSRPVGWDLDQAPK